MLGIRGGDPSFRVDDGTVDPAVTAALVAFEAGQRSEPAVLSVLDASRLLVPVVAVPAGETHSPRPGHERADLLTAGQGDKISEMAMPTLIGFDGRRAIPAFTCLDSMSRWRPAARPVPVAARQVWQAAADESAAVVIDVAGPVRLTVEGARLAALARGDPVPPAWADPDVLGIVSEVLAGELAVAAFDLHPGDPDCDLVISLALSPASATHDVTGLAAEVGNAVMTRLGARLRRGLAVRHGSGT